MDSNIEKTVIKIGTLVVLLLVLSFVLVYFNIVSCGSYSSLGCDIYYSAVAGGKPNVLIVTGEEGSGNPELLYEILRGPKFRARSRLKQLSLVSLPLLRENQLVIVEKARVMSKNDIKMFMEYVNLGGKLVWVGDAGTLLPKEEADLNYYLTYANRGQSGQGYIGPWARKDGDKQVSFDYLLGVNFKSNYCDLTTCYPDSRIGVFDFVDSDKKIVYGLSQNLAFYGDFSVVKLNSNAYQTSFAFLEHGSDLIGSSPPNQFWLTSEKQNFGNDFPLIVSSGAGGRVLYYAFPPEYFVSEEMPIDSETGERIQYWALLENMYYGMLYK